MGQGRVNDEHRWRECTERSAHSFLPSFLCFLFISILSFSFLSFFLSRLFRSNHSLSLPFFSLYFKAQCVYILTTLTSSSLFIVYVCEQQVRERERRERKRERKLESFTLSLQSQKHLYMNRRRSCARSFSHSISKDILYSLLNGLCILLSITLNDSKFVRENMSILN